MVAQSVLGDEFRAKPRSQLLANKRSSERSDRGLLFPQVQTFRRPCPLSRRFGLLYPQQPTFWTRLGMSQVDPQETITDVPRASSPSSKLDTLS